MKPPFTTSDVCIGLFFAVLLAVGSHCFLGVPAGMNGVGPRGMRMVRRLLVVSTLVMLCRFLVVSGSVGVVLRSLPVMLSCFLRHRMSFLALTILR